MSGLEVPQVSAWGEANKTKVAEMLALLDARLEKRALSPARSTP